MSTEVQHPPAPLEFTLPHPTTRNTSIHFHLTPLPKHLTLHLTLRPTDAPGSRGLAQLGSLVYALPNVKYILYVIKEFGKRWLTFGQINKPKEIPLTTPLLVRQESFELATSIARALAGRTKRAVMVGCDFGYGESEVGEKFELVKRIVEGILGLVSVPEKTSS